MSNTPTKYAINEIKLHSLYGGNKKPKNAQNKKLIIMIIGTKILINPNLYKASYTLFCIFNPSFFLNIFESMNNIINSQRKPNKKYGDSIIILIIPITPPQAKHKPSREE